MGGYMNSECAGSADSACAARYEMPLVPLPMVCMAFGVGMILGGVIGHKRSAMTHEGWKGGKSWTHHGMQGHHHHGEGAPPCREWHEDWPNPEMREAGKAAAE